MSESIVNDVEFWHKKTQQTLVRVESLREQNKRLREDTLSYATEIERIDELACDYLGDMATMAMAIRRAGCDMSRCKACGLHVVHVVGAEPLCKECVEKEETE